MFSEAALRSAAGRFTRSPLAGDAPLAEVARQFVAGWERRSAPVVRLPPASGCHRATVVVCHGLGDCGQSWAAAFDAGMRRQLPDCQFVFPTAQMMPVTINGGMPCPAWYDIVSLGTSRLKQDAPGIVDSSLFLHALALAELSAIDATPPSPPPQQHSASAKMKKLVLGGFSQGGALSLTAGHTFSHAPGALGGIMCLSGYLTAADDTRKHLVRETATLPLLMCHGTYDDVVPYALAEESVGAVGQLRAAVCGTQADFASFPMGHEACREELDQVMGFLRRCLA